MTGVGLLLQLFSDFCDCTKKEEVHEPRVKPNILTFKGEVWV